MSERNCEKCQKPLSGKQRRWCSVRCQVNHYSNENHKRNRAKAGEYQRRYLATRAARTPEPAS